MVRSFDVAALSSCVATSYALNSAPPGVALAGHVEVDGAGHVEVDVDDVNLLQSSVDVTEKQPGTSIFSHLTHADTPFGSFTSEDYVHCYEGDFHDSETAHSLMRASPITSLYYSHEYHEGQTCESRGYSVLFQENDDCWEHFTHWIRPGTPQDRANYGAADGGLWVDVLDQYDRDHGYPEGTSREWVSCGICTGQSKVRLESWGSSYECASALDSEPRVLAAMGRATDEDGNLIPRGSITPNSGATCFEGSISTLEHYLERTLTTPLGALFSESAISDQTCLERGYDMPRDLIDECWADTAKVMRAETEDEDLGTWVMDYINVLHGYDSSELSGGRWNTLDWVACNACFPGGAVRARGLWTTMHGGDSLPYSETYCRAVSFPESVP